MLVFMCPPKCVIEKMPQRKFPPSAVPNFRPGCPISRVLCEKWGFAILNAKSHGRRTKTRVANHVARAPSPAAFDSDFDSDFAPAPDFDSDSDSDFTSVPPNTVVHATGFPLVQSPRRFGILPSGDVLGRSHQDSVRARHRGGRVGFRRRHRRTPRRPESPHRGPPRHGRRRTSESPRPANRFTPMLAKTHQPNLRQWLHFELNWSGVQKATVKKR